MESLRAKISQDQKHSSAVAQRCYKKRLSREIATKGKQCMEKMLGSKRTESTSQLTDILDSIDESRQEFDDDLLNKIENILQADKSDNVNNQEERPGCSKTNVSSLYESPDVLITGSTKAKVIENSKSSINDANLPTWPHGNKQIEVKEEIYENNAKSKGEKKVKFTHEEDKALYDGIKKHGKGRWSKMLKDQALSFQECRTRDTLRLRAESATFRNFASKMKQSDSITIDNDD